MRRQRSLKNLIYWISYSTALSVPSPVCVNKKIKKTIVMTHVVGITERNRVERALRGREETLLALTLTLTSQPKPSGLVNPP